MQAIKVFGDAAIVIVSAVLIIFILAANEIIQKTIVANYWRNLAKISSSIIHGMVFIAYPQVLMSAVITKVISKNKIEQTHSNSPNFNA